MAERWSAAASGRANMRPGTIKKSFGAKPDQKAKVPQALAMALSKVGKMKRISK
jgi:hypothetical protein